MKTIRLWALCLLSAYAFCACGSSLKGERDSAYFGGMTSAYENIERTTPRLLDLPRFNAIHVSNTIVVNYKVDPKCSVTMSCAKGKEDKVDIYVKDGTLIAQCKGNYSDDVKLVLDVTAPRINEVQGSGATIFNAPLLKGDKMTLAFTGASTANIDKVDGNEIALSCSGASKLNDMEAKANKMDFSIGGASKASVAYKGKNAKVNICGASDITLDVDCDDLQMESSGASKIVVKGSADKTDIKGHGASKIDSSGLNQY